MRIHAPPNSSDSVSYGMRQSYRLLWLVSLVILSAANTSCYQFSEENYRRAVESGRSKIDTVSEIEQVFAGFDIQHFIGHSGGGRRAMTLSLPRLDGRG